MAALVLALNPSIDAEWRVRRVRWEEKNNIESERRWAGGKGVNVARWLRHLGGKPALLLPLGGTTGRELAGHLRREHLAANSISLREATRVNVIVTASDGRQMRFNPLGPKLTQGEWGMVLTKIRELLKRASCLVLSGSLPRGVGVGAYAELIRLARRAGVKTILDCDGAALAAAIAACPFLVKPNEHELAEWFGRRIATREQLIRAARAMSAKTGGWVLVSLGSRGALLVNQRLDVALFARSPRAKVVNTVGAGDALVAAVARQIELGTPPEEWLRAGVTTGTAATQCAAGELASKAAIGRVAKRVNVA
jgi:1-phosphofructokinase family hexose kinase